jgi:hypothetical protein
VAGPEPLSYQLFRNFKTIREYCAAAAVKPYGKGNIVSVDAEGTLPESAECALRAGGYPPVTGLPISTSSNFLGTSIRVKS